MRKCVCIAFFSSDHQYNFESSNNQQQGIDDENNHLFISAIQIKSKFS